MGLCVYIFIYLYIYREELGNTPTPLKEKDLHEINFDRYDY